MRSVFFCFLIMGVAASALAARPAIPPNADVAPSPKIYIVRQDKEPLYACGGPDCAVVGTLELGERMAIQETVGNWYRVRGLFTGKSGWVNVKNSSGGLARVTAKALNLRSCPGTECEILRVLRRGQRVYVIEQRGGWSKVRIPKTQFIGWVFNKYIAYV